MSNNNQRKGALSNSRVGRDFEDAALRYFEKFENLTLERNVKISVGISEPKKQHAFDLGCSYQKILVECKSHKWTEGNNVPSAKMTVWNEAMYYFLLAPGSYRKIMFVLKDYSHKKQKTLAQYYIDRYQHLIPNNVEFMEFDESNNSVELLKRS